MNISFSSTEFINIFEKAIQASIMAGAEIMKVYKQPFLEEIKDDGSPITIADRKANEIILGVLGKTNIPVISEETPIPEFNTRKQWEYFWLVDPIDGTKEFINKNDEFTVNIALINYDTPVAGIIFAPAVNKFYFGSINNGAYLSEKIFVTPDVGSLEKLMSISKRVHPTDTNIEGYVIPVSRSHFNAKTSGFINSAKARFGTTQLMAVGSSLKFCYLSDGKCNLYPRNGKTYEWDTAAGHAILKSVGGEVYDMITQKPLKYNKPDLLNPYFIAFPDNSKSQEFFSKFL
ncbi:MAG: 3'(2'),5'-bisphosphate nucleotidase CysQ [Bacteroidetes bacterium]|nr:3'(2'),5'-bisphosphate nucleotidase CysQ [Bacteroidota bacterium]